MSRTTRQAGAVDRSPPRLSGAVALGVGAFGVAALAFSAAALVVGVAGVLVVGVGLYRESHAAVTLGGAGLFGGVLVGGLVGLPAELLVFATAAAVVAWDVAGFAIGLGHEVGRAAETTRVELVHAGVSGALALGAGIVGLVVFRLVDGGPTLAPVVLLGGVVVLVVLLRP